MHHLPDIVYVEDDHPSILLMRMVVEKFMKVRHFVVFENSECFIEKLEKQDFVPDLFLLDIQLKPHDGFELLKMLRSNPRYSKAKAVALTASVMNEEIERLKRNGFDGAIAKPLNISIFPKLIDRLMNGESVWHVA